jgi:hypothetical protein
MADSCNNTFQTATRPCINCAEEIKTSARQCIHCKSFQDWRAAFGVSTPVLSLLVALVSVLTVAVPVLVESITPENAKIEFTVQGSTSETIFVLVSNRGNRPGSVAHGALTLDGIDAMVVDLADSPGAVQIIAPGKSELVKYRYGFSVPGAKIGTSHKKCSFSMRITDFRGMVWWGGHSAECIQLTAFLQERVTPPGKQ